MDADKDKPLPEKSPILVASTDDTKTEIKNDDNNVNSNENHPEKEKPDTIVDQDSPKKHEPDHSPDANHNTIDTIEPSENKELESQTQQQTADDDDQTNTKEEEEEEESPPQAPDLEKLSEEIDQYILTLSTPTKTDTSPPDDVPHFVQQFAALVEAKIGDYDSTDNPVKWVRLTEEDSQSFLEYTNRLSSLSDALSRFSSDQNYAPDALNRVGCVLQRAMSYAEEEFKSLLEDYKINNDPSVDTEPDQDSESLNQNNNNFFPGYSDQTLSELARLSKALIVGGHETECCQAYYVARRNALEDSIHKLGFEKYSIDEVQKLQWESLEREVVSWIATFKQCFSVHFPGEKKVSESVFSDDDDHRSIYCTLSQGIIIQLLNFAGAVALAKRGAEKLFKFLDMYETLGEILPAIDCLFPEEEDIVNDIKSEASRIRGRFGEAMISIFAELENSIGSDSVKTPVPGGAVHPLTRYTMNYLKLACEYKETLEQVFREHQKIERADSANFNYNNNNNNPQAQQVPHSPFQAQMSRVMDLLDANIEGKSRMYKDNALSSIFLMNNGRYILQKVKGSEEIISLMGDSWCRNRSSGLRNYHKVYQRETWGRLLQCLHPEGLTVNGKVVKPVLKERFKSFNTMFDEIHKAQSNWVVSDEQLQSEMRVSISNMVIPAYRSFLARYSQVFTPGRQTEKHIKYQAEEIETLIDELFDGNAAPAGRKKT